MDMQQWKMDVINNPIKRGMPILSFPVTNLMGISVKDLISDSDMMAKGMKMLADRLPTLAALSMMDLTVETECFGGNIEFFEDMLPNVTNVVVRSWEDAEALQIPKVGTGRTGIYIDAVHKAKELITDRSVFAWVIGPYTLAGRLLGMSELMTASVTDPDMVKVLMEKVTEFIIIYAQAYKDAGADGFILAEPTTGLISPSLARKLSHPYTKAVIDVVQCREYVCIYHNCGESVTWMAEDLGAFHADGYHFGNCIKMEDIIPLMPADCLVMGNVAPIEQFVDGTPEGVACNTREILAACDRWPNFIISSGYDIPSTGKWENIDAFFSAIDEFYRKKCCKRSPKAFVPISAPQNQST